MDLPKPKQVKSRRVMQIVLYDLRNSDAQNGFVQTCNESLATDSEKVYLHLHGPIGSEKWWAQFDAGEIELEVRSGRVTHIGVMSDELSDETENVICFETISRQSYCYDLDGIWADQRIQIGDIINVLRTKVVIPGKYGDTTWFIDIRISLEKGANHCVNLSGKSCRT